MGRNVILTGFMGTGKTSVGRELARLLDYCFVDTDQVIEERYGPIPEIFATSGEAEFRRCEREVATELAGQADLVVSTGGRLMLDDENARVLGQSGAVFCLTAGTDEIIRRVLSDPSSPDRPLLATGDPSQTPADRVRALQAERAPLYARFTQIDTEDRLPTEIATELVDRLDD